MELDLFSGELAPLFGVCSRGFSCQSSDVAAARVQSAGTIKNTWGRRCRLQKAKYCISRHANNEGGGERSSDGMTIVIAMGYIMEGNQTLATKIRRHGYFEFPLATVVVKATHTHTTPGSHIAVPPGAGLGIR